MNGIGKKVASRAPLPFKTAQCTSCEAKCKAEQMKNED